MLLAVSSLAAEPESIAPIHRADDLLQMSLEDLGQIKVTSVSRRSESLSSAPAAVYVVTQDEIRRSGVTALPEALRLAPGLSVARANSRQWAISARGFNDVFANKLLVLIVLPSAPDANDAWWTSQGGFRLDWEPNPADTLTVQGDYYSNESGGKVYRHSPLIISIRDAEVDRAVYGKLTLRF